jgi:hypothetical protein
MDANPEAEQTIEKVNKNKKQEKENKAGTPVLFFYVR